ASGLSALARGRRAIVAWGALLIVASVAEALPHRLLLVPAALPAGYGVVRDDPGAYAILDLPSGVRAGSFGLFSSLYMAYQTGHGRPLAEGTVARLPIGRRYVFEQDDYRLATHPELKYVIVHRGMFPSVYPREPSERLLAEARVAGDLVFADAETEVYRLRTYSPSRGETSRGAAQPARSASGAAPGGPGTEGPERLLDERSALGGGRDLTRRTSARLDRDASLCQRRAEERAARRW